MKFHFFTSLFLLSTAAFMVVLGLIDPQIFIYLALLEFVIGIQQIISSLVALIVLKKKSYFLVHMIFSILFVLIFLVFKGFGISDKIVWPIVFSVPWFVAVYHTYKLYRATRV